MKLFIRLVFLLMNVPCFATVKTWAGGASGSWSNAANWSPSGVPASATSPSTGDDIVFDGSLATMVTITDYPAKINTDYWGQLSLINNVTVNLSSGSDTYMYYGSGISVSAGSRLNIGETTSTFFELGNKSAVANSGMVNGIIEMKGTGTNAVTNRKVFNVVNFSNATHIYGKLIMSAPAAQLTGANQSVFLIESGGEMQWARDGLSLPGLTCSNGGTINITGIVTAPLIFNNAGNYLGLIIWNCPSQTGQGIPVVPSVGLIFNVDSVRIVNTGSGSACLGTSPCYAVGHLEVQGGIMYLGSPTTAGSVSCTSNTRINTDIKVTGGILIGNATFTGDTGNAYPFALAVNGNLIITGGTFNLTNRPTGLSPGGSMQLNVKGNISQLGGSIFSTSAFASQNYFNMAGTGAQTLELNTFADIDLTITNTSATLGVTLANNVTIPSSVNFTLTKGYVKLGDYTLTVPASRFFQNVFSPMPKIVTNGYGKLKLTGITASATKVFPVAPFAVNSYDPVTITTTAGAVTNDYSVRVERGTNPAGIYSSRVINRTWTINAANTINANTVGITYQYNDSAKKSLCIASNPMEEGHYTGGVWNVDPSATLLTPSGTDPYTVGPFAPNSLDSSFAIGNLASILAIQGYVQLSAQKNNNTAKLKWEVNSVVTIKHYVIERSANGQNYRSISVADAGSFNYTDVQLLPGLNYYRIRMITMDGHSYYSNTVAILNADKGTVVLNISPNPVPDGRFTLQVASALAGKMNIRIVDMQGRIINKQNIALLAGFNNVEMNVASLPNGTYYIYGISPEERTAILRFVKQ